MFLFLFFLIEKKKKKVFLFLTLSIPLFDGRLLFQSMKVWTKHSVGGGQNSQPLCGTIIQLSRGIHFAE